MERRADADQYLRASFAAMLMAAEAYWSRTTERAGRQLVNAPVTGRRRQTVGGFDGLLSGATRNDF